MKQLSTRHNRAGSVTRIRQFSFSGLAQIGVVAILLNLSIFSSLEAQEDMDEMVDGVASRLQPPKVKARAGDLDTSFGGDGIVQTPFGTESSSVAGIAIQKDGKVVVVGNTTRANPGPVAAVARYNTNGTLDTTFASGGRTTTSSEGGQVNSAAAVAIQADGKIAVVGTGASTSDANEFSLLRYNTNGALDTSFGGGDGKVLTNFGSPGSGDLATAIAIQADGKILVVGTTQHDNIGPAFGVARYDPNGSLDTTFDGDGMITTVFPGTDSSAATSVKIQTNGKIVVAGYAQTSTFETGIDFALGRYNSNRSLDTSFDADGMLLINFGDTDNINPGTDDTAAGLAIQPDGKIVVAGTVDRIFYDCSDPYDCVLVETPDFGLARLLSNGNPDNSFSGDGKTITDFGGNAAAVALQVDGKIVTVGPDSVATIAITRHNPNGELDMSFGSGGRVTTVLPAGNGPATAVAIQPKDGRIVAAGTDNYFQPGNTNFAVMRYHAIVCSGYAATMVGTRENDILRGTAGDDVIFGAGGDDRIFGLNGDDVLCGGSGDDTLFGGGGLDICDGGSGEDEEHGCEIVHSIP